ncbi:hypothetical protein [Bathymodiolus japonicus methanotrophic gill symbiont]|uniref:hypothetical protein n=1 Tax=Bathymodiolus japonicus methanotrophic gill symbiont TaxID=113269 RepID=UPI001C8EE9E7|nr:hypothetical protein [Bathymodiolus japonicus methanotrophic gill symbiont]
MGYDVNINGVLSQITDHNSTVNYGYDLEKRLILTERNMEGKTSSIAYNYDIDGNINEIT